MTNNQHKLAWLRSHISSCLILAETCAKSGARKSSLYWAERALAFARQLPDNGKNRAIRAQIVQAIETGKGNR